MKSCTIDKSASRQNFIRFLGLLKRADPNLIEIIIKTAQKSDVFHERFIETLKRRDKAMLHVLCFVTVNEVYPNLRKRGIQTLELDEIYGQEQTSLLGSLFHKKQAMLLERIFKDLGKKPRTCEEYELIAKVLTDKKFLESAYAWDKILFADIEKYQSFECSHMRSLYLQSEGSKTFGKMSESEITALEALHYLSRQVQTDSERKLIESMIGGMQRFKSGRVREEIKREYFAFRLKQGHWPEQPIPDGNGFTAVRLPEEFHKWGRRFENCWSDRSKGRRLAEDLFLGRSASFVHTQFGKPIAAIFLRRTVVGWFPDEIRGPKNDVVPKAELHKIKDHLIGHGILWMETGTTQHLAFGVGTRLDDEEFEHHDWDYLEELDDWDGLEDMR